jgi:hypothetical protein
MIRLCLMIACLNVGAWTQASADNLSPDPPKTPKAHATKAKHLAAAKSASLDDGAVRFSDPYAPPEGTTIVRKSAGLPGYSYRIPTDPQGGLSISMGQDQGGHTTGGLKWGF